MIKAIGTFLNTEHPGLTNVSDIFTVGISVISIVIAFMSYDYVKNHDRQIAKTEAKDFPKSNCEHQCTPSPPMWVFHHGHLRECDHRNHDEEVGYRNKSCYQIRH